MPEVLDEHGNYGAIVRFTKGEWEAVQTLLDMAETEEKTDG